MRGFVAEAFSWSVVQPVLCQSDFFVGNLFEPAMFGEELAQQTVEVFVGAAFSDCVRMHEVVAQLQFFRGSFMLGKLLAIVGGQRMRHMGEGVQLLDDCLAHARRLFAGNACDERVATLSFVDGHQRL